MLRQTSPILIHNFNLNLANREFSDIVKEGYVHGTYVESRGFTIRENWKFNVPGENINLDTYIRAAHRIPTNYANGPEQKIV
ncbi:hypothetical protein J6590_067204 [Homalodisca vitripennis]|nr:hypothetical protein J6590_067204 [Homalodisca vitripennis]